MRVSKLPDLNSLSDALAVREANYREVIDSSLSSAPGTSALSLNGSTCASQPHSATAVAESASFLRPRVAMASMSPASLHTPLANAVSSLKTLPSLISLLIAQCNTALRETLAALPEASHSLPALTPPALSVATELLTCLTEWSSSRLPPTHALRLCLSRAALAVATVAAEYACAYAALLLTPPPDAEDTDGHVPGSVPTHPVLLCTAPSSLPHTLAHSALLAMRAAIARTLHLLVLSAPALAITQADSPSLAGDSPLLYVCAAPLPPPPPLATLVAEHHAPIHTHQHASAASSPATTSALPAPLLAPWAATAAHVLLSPHTPPTAPIAPLLASLLASLAASVDALSLSLMPALLLAPPYTTTASAPAPAHPDPAAASSSSTSPCPPRGDCPVAPQALACSPLLPAPVFTHTHVPVLFAPSAPMLSSLAALTLAFHTATTRALHLSPTHGAADSTGALAIPAAALVALFPLPAHMPDILRHTLCATGTASPSSPPSSPLPLPLLLPPFPIARAATLAATLCSAPLPPYSAHAHALAPPHTLTDAEDSATSVAGASPAVNHPTVAAQKRNTDAGASAYVDPAEALVARARAGVAALERWAARVRAEEVPWQILLDGERRRVHGGIADADSRDGTAGEGVGSEGTHADTARAALGGASAEAAVATQANVCTTSNGIPRTHTALAPPHTASPTPPASTAGPSECNTCVCVGRVWRLGSAWMLAVSAALAVPCAVPHGPAAPAPDLSEASEAAPVSAHTDTSTSIVTAGTTGANSRPSLIAPPPPSPRLSGLAAAAQLDALGLAVMSHALSHRLCRAWAHSMRAALVRALSAACLLFDDDGHARSPHSADAVAIRAALLRRLYAPRVGFRELMYRSRGRFDVREVDAVVRELTMMGVRVSDALRDSLARDYPVVVSTNVAAHDTSTNPQHPLSSGAAPTPTKAPDARVAEVLNLLTRPVTAAPAVSAHTAPRVRPAWLEAVYATLGEDAVLVFAGGVVALHGAEQQQWHKDGALLFGPALGVDGGDGRSDSEAGHAGECLRRATPAHALNVFVPLEALLVEKGPTQFQPCSQVTGAVQSMLNAWERAHTAAKGTDTYVLDHDGTVTASLLPSAAVVPASTRSHAWSAICLAPSVVTPLPAAGTAVLMDYRVTHRGSAHQHSPQTAALEAVARRQGAAWACAQSPSAHIPTFPVSGNDPVPLAANLNASSAPASVVEGCLRAQVPVAEYLRLVAQCWADLALVPSARPLLFLTFARPWWRDHINYSDVDLRETSHRAWQALGGNGRSPWDTDPECTDTSQTPS